ncbi:MAG: transketolase C-terminal domain-containing protein, partial [Gemmatimonadaceae bacterium]
IDLRTVAPLDMEPILESVHKTGRLLIAHEAVVPFGIGAALDRALPLWFTEGMGYQFYFGGTSLLIVVGVAMDTVQQVESQLIMRHYDGFMKKTRIRGRRA